MVESGQAGRRDGSTAKSPVRNRIEEVRRHMMLARELMGELENELAVRSATLQRLQADAERYERLATLNAEQARAVEELVGRQFRRQGRIAAVQWWLSIVLAIVFGFLVNWLSAPVWNWIAR